MPDYYQLPNYNSQQQELFSRMFGDVGPDSYLSKLASGDQSTFEQMEAPAMKQFQGMQSGLASQFSGGLGGGPQAISARRSSGHYNAQNQAASDFAQQLQSNRQNLRMQAIQGLHGMSMDLLNQRPFDYVEKQRRQKRNWFGSFMGGAASGIGGLIGGPIGSAIGGGIGGLFGNESNY